MSGRVRWTRDSSAVGGGREQRAAGGAPAPAAPPAFAFDGNSVVEPGSAVGLTDLLGSGPLFAVVRRGYDQLAVDAYVGSTEEELATLRRRLHAAVVRHRAAADALVAARRRPEDQAEELLAEARAEAEARLANVAALREAAAVAREEARSDRVRAAEELTEARREAEALRREAAAVREDAAATAARRRAALDSEMAELRRQRDDAVAGLRRLTGQIELALHSLTDVLPADGADVPTVHGPRRELVAG